MGGAKQKDLEGAMLGQCHFPLGMLFVVAVFLGL